MRISVFWRWGESLLLGLALVGLLTPGVDAANVPAYDVTAQRTRLVTAATSGMASQLYSDIPVYVQIPPGTQSFSTPNVVGNTVFQYTFSSGGQGYLSSFALPSLTAAQVGQQAGSRGYVIQSAAYTHAVVQFAVGYSGSENMAGSQASLSTGPMVNGQPQGPQYQAIGVGKYLYSWAAATYPSGGSPNGSHAYIYGNPGNTDFQVDDSPLITPSVTVSGVNLNNGGTPTTWQSPMAVVGSWDGGLVASPVYIPAGDITTRQIDYTTTQPLSNGSYQYPHSTADITSDPTWVGTVPGLGADCVAFGIAGGVHPRVILFNVATGQYKALGVGTIGAGISDATVWDAATGTLFVQDLYGGLYGFGLNGALQAHYWPASWTSPQEILGQDMALAGSTLYAVGGGGNILGAFSSTLQPQQLTSAYGPSVSSPAVVTDPSGQQTVLVSNSQGDLWLNNSGALFASDTNTYHEAIATPTGSQWIGYLPDAGTAHDLVGWTNRDPQHQPALVVYVPMPYAMRAGVSSPTIRSGQSVTVYGSPLPQTVTANSTHDPLGAASPVAFETFTATGFPVDNWLTMQHLRQGLWAATWTPPVNPTAQPLTYTLHVQGWDALNQTASATTTVTVEPQAPPVQQTSTTSGTLSLTCGFGAGGLPITVPHSCTLNGLGIPAGESAAWFAANPQYGAKFGDTIALRLTVPPPPLPALPSIQVTGEQLQARLPYTEGVPNMPGSGGDNPQGQSLYNPNSGTQYWMVPYTMTLTPIGPNSLTAQGYLIESWDGYPPHLQNANVGNTYTLHANWTLKTSYSWVQTVTQCAPPPSSGGASSCTTFDVTHHGTMTSQGTASAPVTVNGTDYYAVATPMGVGY